MSLQGAAKQIIQPKYTLHKFNWSDQRAKDGTPLVRTLRVFLTNALPDIIPEARRAMKVMLDRAYDAAPTKNGKKHFAHHGSSLCPNYLWAGCKAPPLFPIIIESIAYCNAMAFFGKEIGQSIHFPIAFCVQSEQRLTHPSAQNESFIKASVGFIENTLISSEIVRLLPSAVSQCVYETIFFPLRAHQVNPTQGDWELFGQSFHLPAHYVRCTSANSRTEA